MSSTQCNKNILKSASLYDCQNNVCILQTVGRQDKTARKTYGLVYENPTKHEFSKKQNTHNSIVNSSSLKPMFHTLL